MNIVISISPLSAAFKTKLETLATGSFEYHTAASLKQHSIKALIKTLRQLKAEQLFCATEDPDSLVTLPILITLCAFTPNKKMWRIAPNFEKKPLKKYHALGALTATAIASLRSLCSAFNTYRKLKSRPASYPNPQPRLQPKSMLFVNANLWFGVKAGGSVGHIAGVVNSMQKDQQISMQYAAISDNTHIDAAVDRVPLKPLKHFGIPTELNYYRFSQHVSQQLLAQLKKRPVDCIYQRLSICNDTGVRLSEATGIPLVIEYNGSEVWCAEKWGSSLKFPKLALLAEQACLKQAHTIVTISQVLKDELIERGVPAEKIVFYPNCIDPSIFSPKRFSSTDTSQLRTNLGLNPQHKLATFIGTFGNWHGVDVLARIIRTLIDTERDWLEKEKLHFCLAGDGQNMPLVRATLNQADDTKFVTLTGLIPQDQAPLYLASSDILLSPHVPNPDGSPFFGSPTKLFEYMAMGKPIIASRLGQIADVLQPSLAGHQLNASSAQPDAIAILCEPGNETELITALKFAVENPNVANELGRHAKICAHNHYTWQQHTQAILAQLKNSS